MRGQTIRNAVVVILFSTVVASASGIVLHRHHLRFQPKRRPTYQPTTWTKPKPVRQSSFSNNFLSKVSWNGGQQAKAGHLLGRCCLGQKYDLLRLAQRGYQNGTLQQQLKNLWSRLPKDQSLRSLIASHPKKARYLYRHFPDFPWHKLHKQVSPCRL